MVNLGCGIDIPHVNGIALRVAGDWFTYDTVLEGWSISGGIGGGIVTLTVAGQTFGCRMPRSCRSGRVSPLLHRLGAELT